MCLENTERTETQFNTQYQLQSAQRSEHQTTSYHHAREDNEYWSGFFSNPAASPATSPIDVTLHPTIGRGLPHTLTTPRYCSSSFLFVP